MSEGNIGDTHIRRSRDYMIKRARTLATKAFLTALISGVLMADARADRTAQSTFVYVAGKGKYCKETAVSGYLDCFYASMQACEKRNKSGSFRCVPNPNSGT